MSDLFSLDSIVENVKILVDNNRCIVCDEKSGTRWRYSCGHVVCGDCVISTGSCLLCLTPPGETNEPIQDLPLTKIVKKVQCLLYECQDVFNIDVNRRYRLSEQFKIEKELFPDSIHVFTKYHNKKKHVASKQKENRQPLFFPGEEVPSLEVEKMEKTSYVENWLHKNEKILSAAPTRKPFQDLNINNQDSKFVRNSKIKHRADKILEKVNENINAAVNKKAHKRKIDQENLFQNKIKQIKKEIAHKPHVKWDNNESGIEIDEDVILIDDSQTVDKDQQALLAIVEAEKQHIINTTTSYNTFIHKDKTSEFAHVTQNKINKVPFLKRADLYQSCINCKTENSKAEQTKDLSITIENDLFVTTIKMTNISRNTGNVAKSSISVQTDICNISQSNLQKPVQVKPSQDVFMEDVIASDESQAKIYYNYDKQLQAKGVSIKTNTNDNKPEARTEDLNTSKGVMVAESDSDSDINDSFTVECRAQIHRSSDQVDNKVLTTLDSEVIVERNNRTERGITPTSSNSSEKENFNPNRAKRLSNKKKKKF